MHARSASGRNHHAAGRRPDCLFIMGAIGISSNIMSFGGIAIAIGAM